MTLIFKPYINVCVDLSGAKSLKSAGPFLTNIARTVQEYSQ